MIEDVDLRYDEVANKRIDMDALFKECTMIMGDRGKEYGAAKESFDRIARFWSAYLSVEISGKDVALMLSLFKIAREQGGHKHDNIVDGINYLALSEMI